MRRASFWIAFLLILFVSGYYREVIFKSINAIIKGEEFFYAKTMALPALFDWSVAELIRLKYILTVSFTLWFALISLLGLKLSFKESTAYFVLIGLYVLIGLISLASLGLMYFIGFETVYPFLRSLIGAIHNPIPYMLISIGVYAYKKLNE
tara:strand:+ start:421 stop:873 length:453 start_codon:yes stop_codon:yes gene_type:complete